MWGFFMLQGCKEMYEQCDGGVNVIKASYQAPIVANKTQRQGSTMTQPYVKMLKEQDFPERFHFYLKQKQQRKEQRTLNDLVRPRLKIAIVTETWPPEINGVALSLMRLCKGFQARGHKILLIRPEQQQPCRDFSPNQECLVRAQKIPKYKYLQFGWPQLVKVGQAIEQFRPDVVHIVTEGPLGLAVQQTAKFQKIPVSSGFHSPFHDFSRFFDLVYLVKPIQRYLKWFHNNTALTIVPSADTQQALREFGVTCPLSIVGRGVETDNFHPKHRSESLRQQWGCGSKTKVMLYVGRVSPEKEIKVVLDAYMAMRHIQQQDVRLVIVGDGPDRERLQSFDLNNEVIFTGSLQGVALYQAYASADVFCFASQVETFGNVVLEAMASGLPIIAYDYACANLHVVQHEMGWLSPLGNVTDLMQHMYQMPAQHQLRKMGMLARAVAERIGWQYPVNQFEQALYQVVLPHLLA